MKIISKLRPNSNINLFYSKNEPWWLIGFSMLIGSGLLTEPLIICTFLLKGKLSDIWILWSATIGSAFSISFFSHLWKNIPVKTENEFIFFRYSGMGATILHYFRSLYLSILIIPFLISFSLLTFAKIITSLTSLEYFQAILLTSLTLIGLTFFNNFKNRLKIDFVLFLLFIFIFIILICQTIYSIGGLDTLSNKLSSANFNFELIPNSNSINFNSFLVFISIQWWSASILDYPDMNGQKIMASKNNKSVLKSIFIPSFLMLFFRIFFFSLRFMAVLFNSSKKISDPELVIGSFFIKIVPEWMLIFVILLFLIPLFSFIQNYQNWGGSLLVDNFYKYHIKNNKNSQIGKRIGYTVMIVIIINATIIALFSNSLIGLTKLLFSITAGVGPVFILRWYWWRINAWSQLSAMLSAAIYPFIFDYLENNSQYFKILIIYISKTFQLEHYPIKLIILTISVITTWLIITFITKPTEEKTILNFEAKIKPGGFWLNNQLKTTNKWRFLVWILLSLKGVLSYYIFWDFISGNYLKFAGKLIIYLGIFTYSYYLLNKINEKYDSSFE